MIRFSFNLKVCANNEAETYGRKLLDFFVRCPKGSKTDLLGELSETWISQQGHVTKHLVDAVSAMRIFRKSHCVLPLHFHLRTSSFNMKSFPSQLCQTEKQSYCQSVSYRYA